MGYIEDMITGAKKAKKAEDKKEEPAAPRQEPPKPAEKRAIVREAVAAQKKIIEKPGEVKEAVVEVVIPGKRTMITTYGNVEIYNVTGESIPIYAVPVIKAMGPEKIILNTIKEAATRLITIAPEEIRDPQRRRNYYFQQIKEIITSSPELGVPQTKVDFYAEMIMREMIGYGVLDALVQDAQLEEIMVIGPNKPVYVFHRKYDMLETNIMFSDDIEVQNIIARIARDVNRRVDVQNPLLDARLPDGSRVNATIPPVSIDGATLTIRKFRTDPFTVVDLVKYKTINSELAAFLWMAVDGIGAKPANILISGGTGSGKTTTLNVIASFVPARERIITMEDTAELVLPIKHWVRFETRPPGLEGTGEINMDMLVKNSLRMRPDRIIVGEVRGEEAFTLFSAINVGQDGSMGTLHANSAEETITRVLNPPMSVPPQMVGALDFIINQQRIFDRRKGMIRRVVEVAEITGVVDNKPKLQIVYEWDPVSDTLKPTKAASRFKQTIQRFTGVTKQEINDEIEKRAKFIDGLVKQNIRDMPSVMEQFRQYSSKFASR